MTREELEKLWPILEAYRQGKTIEFYDSYNNTWRKLDTPAFDSAPCLYRIAADPKYRSFQNSEECWSEMRKHEPFGWIIKQPTMSVMIDRVGKHSIRVDGSPMDFNSAFVLGYTFVDGTPFGKREE